MRFIAVNGGMVHLSRRTDEWVVYHQEALHRVHVTERQRDVRDVV